MRRQVQLATVGAPGFQANAVIAVYLMQSPPPSRVGVLSMGGKFDTCVVRVSYDLDTHQMRTRLI